MNMRFCDRCYREQLQGLATRHAAVAESDMRDRIAPLGQTAPSISVDILRQCHLPGRLTSFDHEYYLPRPDATRPSRSAMSNSEEK